MDTIDTAILEALKENGRASASEISRRVRLSVPAVTERIKKLEQGGIIRQYTVKTDRYQTGQRLLAFVFVNIDRTAYIDRFRSEIVQHACVLECHHIAGAYDYLLKVALRDTQALESFLSGTLKKIEGVSGSNTVIALTTLKEEMNV